MKCSLLRASFDAAANRLTVRGPIGAHSPESRLRTILAGAVPGTTITYALTPFTGPYCPALAAVHGIEKPFAAASVRLVLALAGGVTRLAENQLIEPDVTMPRFAGHLEVDYFSSDGSVFHLYPTPTDPDRRLAARATLKLGRKAPGFEGWGAGSPYGRDMILAIASSRPLFATLRPQSETAAAYVPALRAALAAARAAHSALAVDALTLDTYKP